jgi:hypothetical protein
MTTHPNSNGSAQPSPGSAIYVDTENLRDSDHAQSLVARIVANWPADRPEIGNLSLYVRADRVASWEMWAEASYPDLRVRVRGVQHFSNNKAKNSADLAITADAVADLVTGQADAVAVVSNDSDFGALFVKVKELARSVGVEQAPFLWITSPEAGGLSPEMERFIPHGLRWDVSEAPLPAVTSRPEIGQPDPPRLPEPERPAALPPAPAANADPEVAKDAIAEELIRRLPVGRFKVADAHQVVRARWPKHPDVDHPGKFGQHLLNEIWPVLERRGVLMPRTSSPRTYEITQAAKESLVVAVAPPARDGKSASEPTSAQLAVSVAAGIPDDLFKASDAQNALKNLQPDHPASSYTAAQFGTWFAKQLWPIMEQQGVVLASEKPRRYEMTPDARHRLTSLV